MSTGEALIETYSADGSKLISKARFGPETEGEALEQDSIGVAPKSGTSNVASTASGCRRVTVVNRASTTFGQTAYKFNTWTYWCWNRATQLVNKVPVGWSISEVGGTFDWRGLVRTELDRYDYSTNDGHPYSAFKHYRQGRFDNCIVKWGCIYATYSANTLRSYYNGTWAWSTSGV